jgi:hypothetical protein
MNYYNEPLQVKERIKAIFGDKALDFALFHNHELSLRFELSCGRSRIQMFLNAYQKANEIIDFCCDRDRPLHACIAFFGEGNFLSNLSVFPALKQCQILIPKSYQAWQKQYLEDEEQLIRTFICFQIDREELSQLLWGTLANELGIRPRSMCDLYIIDLDRSILVHPYDDRGMDIIGIDRTRLKQIYDRFNNLLSNFDREKMDNIMSS